jgi:hypothetical protein
VDGAHPATVEPRAQLATDLDNPANLLHIAKIRHDFACVVEALAGQMPSGVS